jgi:hypothetical protein
MRRRVRAAPIVERSERSRPSEARAGYEDRFEQDLPTFALDSM